MPKFDSETAFFLLYVCSFFRSRIWRPQSSLRPHKPLHLKKDSSQSVRCFWNERDRHPELPARPHGVLLLLHHCRSRPHDPQPHASHGVLSGRVPAPTSLPGRPRSDDRRRSDVGLREVVQTAPAADPFDSKNVVVCGVSVSAGPHLRIEKPTNIWREKKQQISQRDPNHVFVFTFRWDFLFGNFRC